MSQNIYTARGLYTSPEKIGSTRSRVTNGSLDLSKLAVDAHRSLLTIAGEIPSLSNLVSLPDGVSLETLFRSSPSNFQKRILLDPVTVEAIHGISSLSPELDDWHRRVASPCASQVIDVSPDAARHQLGGLILILILKKSSDWTGEISLLSDLYGRVRFPSTSFNIELKTEEGVLAKEVVTIKLDDRSAFFQMQNDPQPFLVLDRDDFLGGLSGKQPIRANLPGEPHPTIEPRLHFPKRFTEIEVFYDLIHSQETSTRQNPSAELIQSLLSSIRLNSPHIANEFQQFIRTIRGFEIAGSESGIIQSFSDPELPGVMGLNISYDDSGSPLLAPFAFCWFGHELAHTINYLVQNIAYHRGWQFFTNGEDKSPVIERYGRSLSMRTIFQLPYVHFYEWELLINFIEKGFAGLPWIIEGEPIEIGDDLQKEIEESFDVISDCIQLTPLGQSAMQHFQRQFHNYRSRWSKLLGVANAVV